MTIYVSSQADLAAMLSVAAGVVIAASDLIFGIPKPTTDAEKTQYGRNTKLKVRFADTSTVGTGERIVYYDRLDLAPLALANFTKAKISEGANLAAVIPVIKNYTGAIVNSSDLAEAATYKNPDTLGIEFVATALSDSIGWTGSVLLKFDPPQAIASAFWDDRLNGF